MRDNVVEMEGLKINQGANKGGSMAVKGKLITVRRRPRTLLPKDEDRRAKFLRLAPKRVTNTLNSIRRVGNLLNKNVYQADPGELDQIEAALDKQIAALKLKLEQAKRAPAEGTRRGSNVEVFRLQA